MQIGFDFFYDEELAIFSENIGFPKLHELLVLLPEIILCIDSVLKLVTGIYINGVIVEEKKIIIEHYFKTGLLYDFLAYSPILIQGFLRNSISLYNPILLKLLQLLVFCKLKRVAIALSNFEEIGSSKGKHDYVLSGARLTLTVFFISHLNACAWHAIAYYNPYSKELNWLKAMGLEEDDWMKRYCISMYFSVSLMVNSGMDQKFTPQNTIEYLYMIFMLLVSAGLFGYIIFTIKEILEVKSKKSKEYKYLIINLYEIKFHWNSLGKPLESLMAICRNKMLTSNCKAGSENTSSM